MSNSSEVRRSKIVSLRSGAVREWDYNRVNWPTIGACIELTSLGDDSFTNQRNPLDEIAIITDLEFQDDFRRQLFRCDETDIPLHGGYRMPGTFMHEKAPLN